MLLLYSKAKHQNLGIFLLLKYWTSFLLCCRLDIRMTSCRSTLESSVQVQVWWKAKFSCLLADILAESIMPVKEFNNNLVILLIVYFCETTINYLFLLIDNIITWNTCDLVYCNTTGTDTWCAWDSVKARVGLQSGTWSTLPSLANYNGS